MTSPFALSLTDAARPVIMEIKPRDGAGRDLLGGRSVRSMVATYEAAGAPCLSVVTGRWFGGTVELLREVAQLTSLPILRKDFLTRRAELSRSRSLGASAVLLTARLLPAVALRDLIEEALRLDLTPFVEITEERDMQDISYRHHCVVAVANKDVRRREQDDARLDRSLALLPLMRRLGVSCPVSASGIDSPQVAASLLDAGYAGLLVGTALLDAPSAEAWLEDVDQCRRSTVGS